MSERKIKILGILLVFLMNMASGWIFEQADAAIISIRIITLLFFMILQWETAHRVIRYARKKYPRLEQVRKRVTFTAVYFFVLSIALQLLNDLVLDHLVDQKPLAIDPLRLVLIVLNALLFTLTTIGMFEAVYYYKHFSTAELEKEELLRANLQSQYDSLKSQVNPHFLFNSLNSLSSLISKDPSKAEYFVEEMSGVYRYLLRSNEQQVIRLEEELNFIESYLHLLTTRFGNNLQVTIQIAGPYYDYLLPPLTLQMLLENAVKHNIVSGEHPLRISMFTAAPDRLHVVNNLQKKSREVISGKVGLGNIVAKYALLKQPGLEIMETETEFAVIIPLINPSRYESIDY